jgi:hypothetical protein
MTFFSWRCLAALVALLMFAGLAAGEEMTWSADFPGPDGESRAAAFAVGDGRHFVTVGLSGMDAGKGRLRSGGRELPAEVFVDPVSRLVVFRMTGPPGKALRMLSAAPAGSGTLVRTGNGGTGKITGWIKRVDGKILPLSLLRIEYPGVAPLPGTPLIDSSGALVAVAHQTAGTNCGYALPVEVLKRVLEGVQGGGRVSRGWIGLKLQPAAAAPQVTGVQAGSPAARCGVKSGDVLLQVGARRLEEYADAVNAFYFLRPGTVTPLRVKRGSQELTLSVTPVERMGE